MKDRIADFAFQAFHQRGFKSVSMDLVATRLRISKKTIYKHFESKEEVLEIGMQNEFARTEALVRNLIAGAVSLQTFDDLGNLYLEFLQSFGRAFRNELKRDYPHLHERIEVFELQTFRKAFSKTAKDLRSKGKIAYPLPTKELAVAFLGMVKGLKDLPAEHRSFVILTFFSGITTRDAKKSSKKTKRKKKV